MTLTRAGKCLGIVPLLMLLLWLRLHGVSDYPYGDTYTFSARTAIATFDEELSVDHFLQISNGHRLLFSRLVTAFLTITTQWDTRLEVVLNVVMAVVNVWLIVRLIRHFAPSVVPLAWFPVGLFLLSVDQMINWISGVQNLWHFTLMCLLICLHLLLGENRRGWRMLLVAGICAFATFSAGNGMMLWVCMGIAMLILRYDRWTIGVLAMIGIVAIMGYLTDSGIGLGTSKELAEYGQISPPQFINIIKAMLIFIGRPVAENADIAQLTGLLGIGLLLWAIILPNSQKEAQRGVWLLATIAVYTLLSAVQIAITRVHHFDVTVAIAERYLAISLPFWAMLCAIWLIRLDIHRRYAKTIIPFIVVLAICTVHLVALLYQAGRTDWDVPVNHVMLEGECIRRYPVTYSGICGMWIVPDATLTEQLMERRLSGFARNEFWTVEKDE